MRAKILGPLAFCLLSLACAPNRQSDSDVATRFLAEGIDKRSATDMRNALGDGARADAVAGFGNSALHIAASIGDAELTKDVLERLAEQRATSASLLDAISLRNKEEQSPLEIAALRFHTGVIKVFAAFCDSRNMLRPVFFPVAKKLALQGEPSLEAITAAISSYGSAKNHMAQLIFETIGTKEGQVIVQSHDSALFLVDFSKAYLLALDASPKIQDAFFKVASGFRIEKRMELIELMMSGSARDLYRNASRQIEALSSRFGIVKTEAALPVVPRVPAPETKETGAAPKLEPIAPVDQNALLSEAVEQGNLDVIVSTLEKGARFDALDQNLQNVFHIAAKNDRKAAMLLLISQLQCSNAEGVLRQQDNNGFTPFALAANQSAGKLGTLQVLSDFLLSSQSCQEIAKLEMRRFVKEGQEQPFKNAAMALSEANHGVELIADVMYRLMGGELSDKVAQWLEQALCAEAKDHVWARVYFKALSDRDENRKLAIRQTIDAFSEAERQQIVGFMLFLGSGSSDKAIRDLVLLEAESLRLTRLMFDGSSDQVSALKAALDEIVTGQENAKISLAVAIKNHYERVEKGLKKSNILILGPSGSGKTLLVQTIAQKLDVPFALFDATNITQAGYVGGKATDAVAMLAEKGHYKKDKVERGIIFLDEIDKMASRSGRADQDEFKRQGQASLLKMIEGIEVDVPIGRNDSIMIDTSNILFVCAGAFTGLPDIIGTRLKSEGRSLSENVFSQAMAEDLIKYGMAPELLGRLPNVITLRHLSIDDMMNILKNPKSSVLEEYRELFLSRGVEIKFTDGAIRAIAERAVSYNVGARGLRTVAESVISDLQFRVGNLGRLKSITVTERVVRFGDLPSLDYHNTPA